MSGRVAELEKLIIRNAELYYAGKAEIPDGEFDSYVDELRKLDPQNPILKTPGWCSKEKTAEVAHDLKFKRGLDVIKINREDRLPSERHFTTLKYDGASVTLYYTESGNLYKALTRNDGIVGTDVLDKLKYIVPNKIDPSLGIMAVTGEFIVSNQVNEEVYKSDSPRNLAVGRLMRNSVEEDDIKNFSFVAYRIMGLYKSGDLYKYNLLRDRLLVNASLLKLNFNFAPIYIESSEVFEEKFKNFCDTNIFSTTYGADGLVVDYGCKISDTENPNIALVNYEREIAYKIVTESKEVKVTSISWNHTPTNRFVPTIHYEKVFLSGADCSGVAGHNARYIKDNNIGVGTTIRIVRSGEVIPAILGVYDKDGNYNAIM